MANALKEFLTVDFSDLRPIGQSGLFTLPGRPPVGSPIDFSSYASRRQHGILIPELCPDAPPRLVRLWQDISARTWRMPENIRLAPNKRKRRSQANFRSSRQISESEDTSTDWCGSQAVLPSGQSFYYSVIQFNVPQLAVPNPNAGGGFLKESPQGGYTLSVWVGLDGGIANLLPSGANVPGGDIWQAGVDCTINAEGNVSYDTWYQWFSPTMPGDSPATPLTSTPVIRLSSQWPTLTLLTGRSTEEPTNLPMQRPTKWTQRRLLLFPHARPRTGALRHGS